MAVLLCLAAFPLLFVLFWQGGDGSLRGRRRWDEAFILSTIFWAGFAVIAAEALSAVRQLNRDTLAAVWLALDAGLAIVAWLSRRRRRAALVLPRWSLGRVETALFGLLGTYLIALGAIAWSAPANNVDSLQYHMARVVHWAQQGSLAHYPAGNGTQIWYPPGAEILLLNLRLLVGNDRLASFVQWSGYFAAIVGVWWIGGLLRLSRVARWVGVAFAASVPMAVLQATSTQNDLVVALWTLLLGGLVFGVGGKKLAPLEILSVGTVLGMGLLTKATFYFNAAPFVLWFVVSRPWRRELVGSLTNVALVSVVAILLNAGHLSRNLVNSWTPVGPMREVPVQTYASSAGAVVGAAVLRPVQAAILNFATPLPEVNDRIADAFAFVQGLAGVPGDRLVLVWGWNHEDLAGSPIHFLLVLLSGAFLLRQRGWPNGAGAYATCLAAGFILVPLAVAIAVDPMTIRFQLTLLLGWSPLIGLVAERNLAGRAVQVLVAGLVLSVIPWVLFNKTRPIVAMRPDPGPGEIPCLAGCTAVGSVFAASQEDLLFANLRPRLEGYVALTTSLRAKTCRMVGLRIDSHDPEYALWYLLDAPQSGFHLETVYPVVDPVPHRQRDFRPCAIICTICGDRTRLHGLELYSAWQNAALYLGDEFTWDADG